MSLNTERVGHRLRLGEDRRWEFMQVKFVDSVLDAPGQQDLADELAAFANGRGGFLLCGVTDDGRVQGMYRAQMDALDSVLVEACASSVKPPIDAHISRMEIEGMPWSSSKCRRATRSTTVRVGGTAGPAVRSAG